MSFQPFATWLPDWLWDTLEAVNPVSLTSGAILAPCQKCREPVLRGRDMTHRGAFVLIASPRLLTSAAELELVLAGKLTVEVQPGGAGFPAPLLSSRDQWRLLVPPLRAGLLVLPLHECGLYPGVELPWELLYPHTYSHVAKSQAIVTEPPF